MNENEEFHDESDDEESNRVDYNRRYRDWKSDQQRPY